MLHLPYTSSSNKGKALAAGAAGACLGWEVKSAAMEEEGPTGQG